MALGLWTSHQEIATVGSSLPQFLGELPSHWHMTPTSVAVGGAVLLVLAAVGVFHVATGWRGPFLNTRGLRRARGDIMWLAVGAGLWWWGAFLPKSAFGWFDALEMHYAWYTVNFGLQALYLYLVVDHGVTIALLLFGGRINFEPPGGGPRRPVRGS